MRRVVLVLAGATAVSFALAVLWATVPLEALLGRRVALSLASRPLSHRSGQSWCFDLTGLGLADRADSAVGCPYGERVDLLEGGKPLRRVVGYDRTERQAGAFSHWSESLIFSPTQGGKPDPGLYSLRYREAGPAVRAWRAK